MSKGIKTLALFAILAVYVYSFWISLSWAVPAGASLTPLSTDSGPAGTPASRTDPGGTINTISVSTIQQNPGWKAYVGNITGRLVLKNSDSQSIYEWALADAALAGNVFITRSNTINWSPIRCANNAEIVAEDSALGFSSASSDSVNATFNYTIHDPMPISGIGTITASTCKSTATYVNGTEQVMTTDARFQEILLSDTASLVYGTFIDQDAEGFENNATRTVTHDFQIIVGDPKNATSYTYYFYADIS